MEVSLDRYRKSSSRALNPIFYCPIVQWQDMWFWSTESAFESWWGNNKLPVGVMAAQVTLAHRVWVRILHGQQVFRYAAGSVYGKLKTQSG